VTDILASPAFAARTAGTENRRALERSATIPPIPQPSLPLKINGQDGGTRRASDSLLDGQVLGVECQNGHFTDPDVPYCRSCGTSLVHTPRVLSPGPRPPLGVLVLDDGTLHSLDSDLIVGSAPRLNGRKSTREKALRLADPEGTLAQEHLRIGLDGWAANLIDLGSPYGTHVARTGDEDWCRVPAMTPMPLRSGTYVLVGWRSFHYQSHSTR
jgi:hypothetical protein